MNELSAVLFMNKHDLKYMCCGKVEVKKNNKRIIGYVMDEDEENYYVLLNNCFRIQVLRPIVVKTFHDNGNVKSVHYEYTNVVSVDGYVISKFSPVRIKFMKNALDNCQFILNKAVLNNKVKDKVVVNLCS